MCANQAKEQLSLPASLCYCLSSLDFSRKIRKLWLHLPVTTSSPPQWALKSLPKVQLATETRFIYWQTKPANEKNFFVCLEMQRPDSKSLICARYNVSFKGVNMKIEITFSGVKPYNYFPNIIAKISTKFCRICKSVCYFQEYEASAFHTAVLFTPLG